MDTRNILETRRRARGAIRPVTLIALAVIVVLTVAAWFLIVVPHQELVLEDNGGHPSTPVATGTVAAPPPANVEEMGVDQLLAEARKAMNDQRYLAPAGNNAFEFYLKALQKQPGNQVAVEALRETFPFASSEAEAAINARDFADAQRQIDLLAKADPTNFTLTILRSKLDAQRKLMDKEQQQAADAAHQQELAQQKAAADKAAADKLAAEQALAAEQKAAAPSTPRAGQGGEAQGAPSTAAAAPVVAKETPAVLIKAFKPRYPTSARRANQQGYVVVSFTVDTDGKPTDISVTRSQPRHMFDRAAIEAVNRWRFTPAMRNGQPVASEVSNRINFTLGGD